MKTHLKNNNFRGNPWSGKSSGIPMHTQNIHASEEESSLNIPSVATPYISALVKVIKSLYETTVNISSKK